MIPQFSPGDGRAAAAAVQLQEAEEEAAAEAAAAEALRLPSPIAPSARLSDSAMSGATSPPLTPLDQLLAGFSPLSGADESWGDITGRRSKSPTGRSSKSPCQQAGICTTCSVSTKTVHVS